MSAFVTIFMLAVAILLFSLDGLSGSRWNVLNLKSDSDSFSLAVMALLVFALYMHKFSQWADDTLKPAGYPPRPVRNFTTWLQYVFWGSVYGLIGCSIMMIMYKYPTLLTPLQGQAIVGTIIDAILPDGSENLSPLALGVAVSLGFLTLPKLEPIFRRRLQQAALIPSRATHIVNSLVKDFKSFEPDHDQVDKFLRVNDADPRVPTIFRQELFVPDDQFYLEVYPRLEYFLWRIDDLMHRPGFEHAISPHKAELLSVQAELDRVRRTVVNVAKTIAVLSKDLDLDVDKVHRDAGIDRGASNQFAVTVLDDLLRVAKEKDSASPTQKKLVESLDAEIRYARASCDVLLERIIKSCVLAAFSADTKSPENWLKRIGLSYSGDVIDKPDGDTLVVCMIAAVAAATGVVFVLGMFDVLPNVFVATVIAGSMQASGLIAGYFIGSLVLNECNQSVLDPKDVKFSLPMFFIILAGSWAGVIFALFTCAVFLGKGYAPGITLFQTSAKYAHISALLGPAIAWSCFRVAQHKSLFTWWHIWTFIILTIISTWLAVYLHFGLDFVQEPKAWWYLGMSFFIPLIVGLTLRYPVWRPEYEFAEKATTFMERCGTRIKGALGGAFSRSGKSFS